MAAENDDGDTTNMQTLLGIVKEAYLFKIPPKASAMGHMADTWPKQAMWVGRLRILSTATECTLQFETVTDTEEKVYLKVVLNNDPDQPDTIEPAADSSRYFALNIRKPGTDQIFELGLGFQAREDAMDFNMAVGDFERMRKNVEEAKILNSTAAEDFSLAADEVLVMKPMKPKDAEEKKEADNSADASGGGGLDSFLPPPSDKKKTSKKKSKKKGSGTLSSDKNHKISANADSSNPFTNDPFNTDDFGDFTVADNTAASNTNANASAGNDAPTGGDAGNDDSWATFD
eukprot:CAMPEP_0202709126 /NCGR_PEP_ID=MMETSP1385-20130828/21253_1 /ASSEMBLY_ACC=CAM_ASM_000861 /TAXON_ID=933848 /ORGANISM="Elphidium margaritaceum" /LENGTH=287 /DNA_ID=CAMNT_0049368291 /DNA_START=60 /DNA_END=923 /DNA_ORIENTATION=-